MEQTDLPSFRDMYPGLSDEEVVEAEDNFKRYVAIVRQVCERLERERQARDFDEKDKVPLG